MVVQILYKYCSEDLQRFHWQVNCTRNGAVWKATTNYTSLPPSWKAIPAPTLSPTTRLQRNPPLKKRDYCKAQPLYLYLQSLQQIPLYCNFFSFVQHCIILYYYYYWTSQYNMQISTNKLKVWKLSNNNCPTNIRPNTEDDNTDLGFDYSKILVKSNPNTPTSSPAITSRPPSLTYQYIETEVKMKLEQLGKSLTTMAKLHHNKEFMEMALARQLPPRGMQLDLSCTLLNKTSTIEEQWDKILLKASNDLVKLSYTTTLPTKWR